MRTWVKVLVFGLLAAGLSGCWPMPGAGPDRRSFNPSEQRLTAQNVALLTERFRVPLAAGAGPPVVTNLGLFVRTGLSIAAFEPDSGAARWSVQLVPENPYYEPSISDPLIVASGDVMATGTTFGASRVRTDELVTLDPATGAQQRTHARGALGSYRRSDAAVVGENHCCGGDVRFTWIAVGNPPDSSGWNGAAPEAVGGVPTLGDGRLYVATQDDVLAYDTTTACPHYRPGLHPLVCQSEWARSIGFVVTPVVIGDDSTVYVGSADNRVYALRAASGGVRWVAVVGSAVTRPPALAHDTLYVAMDDGRMSAVPAGGCDASECPVAWSTATGSANTVQPAVAGGVVYTGSADGTVKAFDASGCGASTCPPLWTVNTGSPVTGGLAVSNGRLYVGTQGALVSYGLPPG